MTAELKGAADVLGYIAKTIDNFDTEDLHALQWRNSEVIELLNEIAGGLSGFRPEWAEVTISDILNERDALRIAVREASANAAAASVLYEAIISKYRGERDRARAMAVRLEQELAAAIKKPTAVCSFCAHPVYDHDEVDKYWRCGICGSVDAEEVSA